MENVKKMIDSLSSKFSYIFHFLKKRIHIKINTDSVLEHIIVLELYTLLTILAFHKVFILGIDKVLIGDGGDAYQHIWNFWWVKKAILEGKDIFYTDYLFYPKGTHLYSHTLTLSYSLIAFFIQFFTNNLILVYNALILSSFIIASYATFLLVLYITKNIQVSFLGGVYFGFSSYMYAKALGALNLTSIFIFPLFFLLLLKFKDEKETVKLYFFSFFLFTLYLLVFFTDLYYFSFVLTITVIFALFLVLKNRDLFKTLLLMLTILCAFITLSPMIIKMLNFIERCENCMVNFQDVLRANSFDNYYSFSPFSFFSKFNYYLNIRPVYNFSYADSVISFPWSLILPLQLLFLTLMFKKIRLNKREKDLLFLFALMFFVFFILSFGPKDYLLNRENLLFKFYHTIFPYIRVSTRFSVIALLSLIIVCTILLNRLIKKGRSLTLIILLLAIFAYVETFPKNFFFITFELPPSFIIHNIKNEKENITILNLPPEWANSFSMYLQTLHQKKALDGYVSRREADSIYSIVRLKEFLSNKDTEGLLKFFKEQNTRYLIHYKFLRGEAFATDFEEIIKILPEDRKKIVWEDNNYTIIMLKLD
jgi:hypothetical protein